jgi:hypothetical protein
LTLTNGTVPVKIQLIRIIDPAAGDFSPDSGHRYVAAEFMVSDPGPQPVAPLWAFEDATTVVGSDGLTHPADQLDTVSECTSFHMGPFQIVSTQSVTECVVFQIPARVAARTIEFTYGDERGIWSNP